MAAGPGFLGLIAVGGGIVVGALLLYFLMRGNKSRD